MSKSIRLILIVLMLLSLLVLVPSGCNAEIVELPLDGGGLPPQEDCFTDWTYEDPSISVRIEKGRYIDTDYVIAYVKIANASQLRTKFADTEYSVHQKKIERIVNGTNYVLAMNGDWFNSTERLYCRYTCRQGHVYFVNDALRDHEKGWWLDILVIDDEGNLHVEQKATKERLENLPYTPINSFTFGPALIIDGVPQEELWDMTGSPVYSNLAGRTCIAQTGPLEYMLIYTCIAACPNCKGMTIQEFGAFVSQFEGIQTAYTLDGGSSGQLLFHGRKLSSEIADREISDILYFTSAYQPD